MKSRLERIFFSPDMLDVSLQRIYFGSGFKGLGILTLEGDMVILLAQYDEVNQLKIT
jgi:hypothetical protein